MLHRQDEILAMLRASPAWSEMGIDALRAIAYVMRRTVLEPADVLFREGELGEEAYLVVEGNVEIVTRLGDEQEHLVGTLGPGELFGELALFGSGRRMATARAQGAVVLGVLRYEPFLAVIRAWPDAALVLLRLQTRRYLEVDRQYRLLLSDLPKKTAG